MKCYLLVQAGGTRKYVLETVKGTSIVLMSNGRIIVTRRKDFLKGEKTLISSQEFKDIFFDLAIVDTKPGAYLFVMKKLGLSDYVSSVRSFIREDNPLIP
jgi:hypothetical protein